MRPLTSNNSGATLLELLVALCINGIILGGLLSFLAVSAKTNLRWQSLQVKRASFEELRLWSQSGEQGCLSDTRLKLCLTHQDGIIRDSLGAPHIVHQADKRLQPQTTSKSISFLSLEPSLYFTRDPKSKVTRHGSVYHVVLCKVSLEKSLLLPSLYESWLLRTPDGYLLSRGQIKKTSSSKSSCPGEAYEGSLMLEKNLMFAQVTPELKKLSPEAWPRYLMLGAEEIQAVSEAFTLYVSMEGELRRLSHSSTENQPLAKDLESIQLAQKKEGDYLVYLQFAKRDRQKFSFPLKIPEPQAPLVYSLIP